MTLLEERLTAALDARAHQIGENDLSPAVLPEAAPRRRGFTILAAAACTALVIGVPYGIAQLDGSKSPERSPATAPPTPSGVGEGADWPVSGSGEIDLDGDGLEEVMRLRTDPNVGLNPMGFTRARIEVDLPTGTVFTLLGNGAAYHLEGSADIPGSDGEEILVSVGTSLEVFDLVDGELRELEAPAEPPLVRRTDNAGRLVTWAVHSSGLYSLRSIGPVTAGAEKVRVQRWHWTVKQGQLDPGTAEERCVDPAAPEDVVSCVPTAPTIFRPDELVVHSWAETEVLEFLVDGSEARATVVLRPDLPGGDYLSAGDAALEVVAGDATWKTDLRAGDLPALVTNAVTTSSTGTHAVLVRRVTMPEREVWNLFGWVGGELVELTPRDAFFPGFIDESISASIGIRPMRSWLQDGWMYTAVSPPAGEWNVYRWEQSGSDLVPHLVAEDYCFDAAGTGRAC